ncbi:MAG: hypothetical protein HGB21_15600, partial [Nitrospirae bacterium]|nr:hypothetical protein [Nitrospirota bacterium]
MTEKRMPLVAHLEELRKRLIDDYRAYVKSFISIADPRIREHVDKELDENELLWPQ